jgi:LmbE family N-acetylglucosaminyl deacetylase
MHKINIVYPTPELIRGKNTCGRSSDAGPPNVGDGKVDSITQLMRIRGPSDYPTDYQANPGVRWPLIRDPEVNSNSRVMILAPHHYDEIIGCGGTMSKLAKKGAHVKVVLMTDSSYDGSMENGCALVPIARNEADESLAKVHCFESESLDLPCFKMRCDESSIRRLSEAIDYYSPDLMFIPSLRDPHPDNKMTGMLAAHALLEYNGRLTLYSYEVWGGLFPNTIVEITDEMEDKISAIKARHPHAVITDAEGKMREANLFRLSSMQADRYCEPFICQQRVEFAQEVW